MAKINENYIKELSIQGFRGFKDKETIHFAYPNKKDAGSGLNIIVGQNCSGKSTIIETIKLLMQRRDGYFLSKSTRDLNYELKIDMKNITSTTQLKSNKERNWAKLINRKDRKIVDKNIVNKNYFLVPSKKNVANNNLYNNDENIESFLWSYQNSNDNTSINNRRNFNLNNEFMSVLTTIYADKKKKEKFDKILKLFLEDVRWNVYTSDEVSGAYVVEFKDKCGSTYFEGVGDGIITIIYICVGLFMLEQNLVSVLLIDEPEVSLHPEIIKKISNVLKDYSTKYQIIIATHSPYLIDLEAIKNGGKLIRMVNDEKVRVYSLDNKLIKGLKLDSSTNPHIYGTTAKEVFFLKDNIILVEGQEDVVCYKKIINRLFSDKEYNFYGWGSGGAGNILNIMKILNSLGYKKIVGLYDGDEAGKTAANQAKKEINNKYKIINIPMEDVRDKFIIIYDEKTLQRKKKVLQKEGICNEDYKIKDNFDVRYKDDMIKVFEEIDSYFNE